MARITLLIPSIDAVKKAEPTVDFLLGCMSITALALVVWSQFVTGDWQVPFLSVTWSNFQIGIRAVIWLSFVGSTVTYAILSGHPFRYAWTHLAELIVCVCWVPQSELGRLEDYVALLSLTKVVPLDLLQMCGTLAHALKVIRYTAQRFGSHPVVVTGVATAILVTSCSSLLVYVEPKTFPTFEDAAWYAITTVTKTGLTDVAPHTMHGRWVGMFLMLCGWSIFAVFFGLVSEFVRGAILKSDQAKVEDLQKIVDEHREQLAKLLKEQ